MNSFNSDENKENEKENHHKSNDKKGYANKRYRNFNNAPNRDDSENQFRDSSQYKNRRPNYNNYNNGKNFSRTEKNIPKPQTDFPREKFNHSKVSQKLASLKEPVQFVEADVTTEQFFEDELLINLESDSQKEKVEIIGVRYKPVGKIYFFDPCGVSFDRSDPVIVETSRGVELGYAVIANRLEPLSNIVQPLKPIIRKAGKEDLEIAERNKIAAKETLKTAAAKIREHDLKMKLMDAEYTFDSSKLIYYFASENRVDFRALAKELGSIFRVRIELRQIAVRDQTQMLGGVSVCGRPFCCSTFLSNVGQVTVKMAKDQNLIINSSKISGACGRLMCCLKYEHETYEKEYKTMPRINSIVETPEGNGVVIDSNIISGIIKVSMYVKDGDSKVIKPFGKKDVKVIGFLKTEENSSGDSEIENGD